MENLQGVEKEMKKFRDFESAREFARSLNLKSQTEWRKYRISKQMPDDIPSNPNYTYKNNGWKGYGDFLGNGNIAPKDKTYRSFSETKQFIQKLKLNSRQEWNEYCASGEKPDDIPYKVERTYKKEWTTWGDFLGTGTVAAQLKQYRSFAEAREFVRSLGLKNQKEWWEYCKSGNKPDDIPANPWTTYKEWKKK